MTKEQYFEMCAALGSEPKESEIPMDLDDFPPEVHKALTLYEALQDEWDYYNGNYFGKRLEGLLNVFKIFSIPEEEHREYYDLVVIIDRLKTAELRTKKKNSTPPQKPLN